MDRSQCRKVQNAGNSFRRRGDWRRDSGNTGARCISGSYPLNGSQPSHRGVRTGLRGARFEIQETALGAGGYCRAEFQEDTGQGWSPALPSGDKIARNARIRAKLATIRLGSRFLRLGVRNRLTPSCLINGKNRQFRSVLQAIRRLRRKHPLFPVV